MGWRRAAVHFAMFSFPSSHQAALGGIPVAAWTPALYIIKIRGALTADAIRQRRLGPTCGPGFTLILTHIQWISWGIIHMDFLRLSGPGDDVQNGLIEPVGIRHPVYQWQQHVAGDELCHHVTSSSGFHLRIRNKHVQKEIDQSSGVPELLSGALHSWMRGIDLTVELPEAEALLFCWLYLPGCHVALQVTPVQLQQLLN